MSRPRHPTAPKNVIRLICDGRVRLERRSTSAFIHARAYIQGRLLRKTTGTANVREATRVATAWWQALCVRDRAGDRLHGHTFADCAEKFLDHHDVRAARGLVSTQQAKNYRDKWTVLMPLLARARVTDINAEFLEILRQTRAATRTKTGVALTASTIKKDFIFVMGTLKHAKDVLKVLTEVPATPSFTGKFSIQRRGRPFFDEADYKRLHQSAKAQCDAEGLNPRTKRQRQHLYCFILISVGGALRVGEAESVRWCDCELKSLTQPDGTTQESVRMMVLGKHSKGGAREEAYVLFGGVFAYKQMLAARSPDAAPDALLFPESNREGMKRLLKDIDLYEYRDPATGATFTRDRKSLRPTGITLRLDKGDNVSYRDIAKWARTSVQMVADFYDQATPESSAVKVATFKTPPAKSASPS